MMILRIREIVTNLVVDVATEKYDVVIIELTPINMITLHHNEDQFTGVKYKNFYDTQYVTIEGLLFDDDPIVPYSNDYGDSLFSSSSFTANHEIITYEHLNITNITNSLLHKSNAINAKYFAIYKVKKNKIEEVTYGSIATGNSN